MKQPPAPQPPDWWPAQLQSPSAPAAAACGRCLLVDADSQRLWTFQAGQAVGRYVVSTSRFGLGCRSGSQRTPTGWHRVEARIGDGERAGTVFRGRLPQGWTSAGLPAEQRHSRDLITSRILWLRGLEPGWNAGPGCDSYDRYIYIHGTAAREALGQPASIGCVRLSDADVIAVFDWTPLGAPVYIGPDEDR